MASRIHQKLIQYEMALQDVEAFNEERESRREACAWKVEKKWCPG